MSNGYLVAAGPDLAAAREISVGFGLEVIDAGAVRDLQALGDTLVSAPNVGFILSLEATRDSAFVALMRAMAARLQSPQLIVAQAGAGAAFPFLPTHWPQMDLSDARTRAQRRVDAMGPQGEPQRAAPVPQAPPAAEPEPQPEPEPEPELEPDFDLSRPETLEERPLRSITLPPEAGVGGGMLGGALDPESGASEEIPDFTFDAGEPPAPGDVSSEQIAEPEAPPAAAAPEAPSQEIVRHPAPLEDEPALEHDSARADAPAHDDAEFTPVAPAPARQRSAPPAARETAPADATAFAPKKLRRDTPELVRIVVHQPKDAKSVIKAAKKVDPNARPAPQGMSIGDIALGANVGISLEVRGASCEGALQRRSWAGEPIDFSFSVQAEDDVKQAVFLARVFIDDAQIGVLAFTRAISGGKKEESAQEIRLARHKRVFISYASADRETVSVIATAYQMAGVEHFWDRTSLKGGEEWSPRLKKEIERADLFHLCWSKAASQSEWVSKEAEHALKRRRSAKRPEITVQMLDGPPWAPHPRELDAINFDDFVRAAIVGYARGES